MVLTRDTTSAQAPSKERPLVILGAGGFAREVVWHVVSASRDYDAVRDLGPYFLFVDDVTPTTSVDTGRGVCRVVKDWRFDGRYPFLIGIGSPAGKEIMVAKALEAGLVAAPTLVHPRALVQNARVGVGGIIAPGTVVTTDVTIGDYVILNLNVTVGHDTTIEDYVTINPSCSVSGNNVLRRGVTLGAGSVTREKTTIAAGVTTGAQAAIVKDVTEPRVTMVGVPARKLGS